MEGYDDTTNLYFLVINKENIQKYKEPAEKYLRRKFL
jgi:hypothetical protein